MLDVTGPSDDADNFHAGRYRGVDYQKAAYREAAEVLPSSGRLRPIMGFSANKLKRDSRDLKNRVAASGLCRAISIQILSRSISAL